MIRKVAGDILLSKAQAIVQGVGVNDPMNKGLALQLSRKYPGLQKDFDCWCYQHATKPGEAWMWSPEHNVHIVNLITHENLVIHQHYHTKATFNNVKHALTTLVKLISAKKLTSIAIPKLGTGLGDLEWDDVCLLIEQQLAEVKIPVYVYAVYIPGQMADESDLSLVTSGTKL